MNAVEFVKKWGVKAVIERLANAPESATVISGLTCMFFKSHSEDGWSQVYMTDIGECSHTRFAPIASPIEIKELKRLVESHEIVKKLGGLERAKLNLNSTDRCLGYTHVYLHGNGYYCFLDDCVDYIIPERAIDIKLAIKAIVDVEQCQ